MLGMLRSQAKSSNDRNVATALAQTANALEPGAEIVLRKKCQGHCQVIALSPAIIQFRSALPLQLVFAMLKFIFETLNEFLQWFAEDEILGFKVNDA